MTKNDLPVVVYKLLAYIYACMQAETEATVQDAKNLCGANETMFTAAVTEAVDNGFVRGVEIEAYYDGASISFDSPKLTLAGSDYLLSNSTMEKAKKIAGNAFQVLLSQVVSIAAKLS